jgi:hypothetical protein
MNFDISLDNNFISRRLVTEELHVAIEADNSAQPHGVGGTTEMARNKDNDEQSQDIAESTGTGGDTCGFVELVWSIHDNEDQHKTRFLVTEEHDPWFDVLLGKEAISAEQLDSWAVYNEGDGRGHRSRKTGDSEQKGSSLKHARPPRSWLCFS